MKKLFLLTGLLLCLASPLPPALGAEQLESSPWVGWRKGYDAYDRAAACRDDRQYEQALELFRQSRDYYMAVQKNFPDWNRQVVSGRIKLCEEEIANIRKITGRAAIPPSSAAVPRRPADDPAVRRPRATGGSSVRSDGAGQSGRLYIEMQSELEQYRQRLRMALQEIDTLQVRLQQAEARGRDVDGLLRDYRQLQDKYTLLEVRYKDAQARADEPGRIKKQLEDQLAELKLQLDESAAGRHALEEKLAGSRRETALARQENAKLRDEAKNHANAIKRMEREVELARIDKAAPVSDEESWRKRVEALEKEAAGKEQRLNRVMKLLAENSDATAAGLAAELQTMQNELNSLRHAAQAEEGLRRRATALTGEIENLRGQLHRSGAELQLLRNEKASLQAAARAGQNAAQVAHQDLKLVQDRAARLEDELKIHTKRYADLEKRYQDRVNSDTLNNQELSRRNTELAARLSDARAAQQRSALEAETLKRAAETAQSQLAEARRSLMELKTKLLSGEIEVRKMADLQKAYDELKHRFELIRQASNADVLASLNRIPGLEESLRRYEQENTALLKELKKLRAQTSGGRTAQPPAAEAEKVEDLLAEARAAEARNNLEVAIWCYRQALARDPDNREGARRLGAVHLARGQFEEALPLLEKAHREMPQDARVLDDLVRAKIGGRDYAGALQSLHDYRRAQPKHDESFLLLSEALAWSRSGKAAEAEKAFKAVLKNDPENAEAAYELALMLSAAPERRKEAGEFYLLAKERGVAPDSYLEKVLQSVTGSDRATQLFLLRSARAALEQNNPVAAGWYLSELKKLDPDNAEARLLEMADLILRNRAADAVKLAEDSSSRAGDAERVARAAALLEAGRAEEAQKLLKQLPEQAVWQAPEILKKRLQKYSVLKNRLR